MSSRIPAIKAKIQTAINVLIKDAINANRDDFTVFIDFAGHVNHLTIDVHPNGFDTQKKETLKNYIFQGYTKPFPRYLNDVLEWQQILNDLNTAKKALTKLKAEHAKKIWEPT